MSTGSEAMTAGWTGEMVVNTLGSTFVGHVPFSEQVLVNLLINAAKYTDAGGDIGLSVQLARGEAIIRVRDSGIGIAPDKLPHVFDLFMQVDQSTRLTGTGLGIGLALVRGFVEAHGGRVDATSAGFGPGQRIHGSPTDGRWHVVAI